MWGSSDPDTNLLCAAAATQIQIYYVRQQRPGYKFIPCGSNNPVTNLLCAAVATQIQIYYVRQQRPGYKFIMCGGATKDKNVLCVAATRIQCIMCGSSDPDKSVLCVAVATRIHTYYVRQQRPGYSNILSESSDTLSSAG